MVVLSGAVVFDTVRKGYCVDDKVIVQMVFFVKVGGDDHLIAVAPEPGRQLYADFMCQFRRGLAGGKGLIAVIAGSAALIMHQPLCLHELLRRRFLAVEIEAGNIGSFLGFHFIGGIFHHTFDFMKLRESFLVMRFLRIAGVIDDLIHSPFYGPD